MRNPKRLVICIAAAGSVVLASSLSALADEHKDTAPSAQMTAGQMKLSSILEGYAAGEPINCLRVRAKDHTRVIDGTALVFRRGNRLWVNYTRNPDQLDDRDAVRTQRIVSEMCTGDIMSKFVPINGVGTGNVVLTEFIPYTRE